MEIDLPESRIVRVNESVQREVVGLLYTYRSLGKDLGYERLTPPQNKRLADSLKPVGRTKFRLSPELVTPILEENASDIAWIEERLGSSFKEDIGAPRPGDVKSEHDLLNNDPAVVQELLTIVGDARPEGLTGETPLEVAKLVHALTSRQSFRMAAQKVAATGPANATPGLANAAPRLAKRLSTRQIFRSGGKQWSGEQFRAFAPLNEQTLVDPIHRIGVVWSAKCACTKVLFWYFDLVGLLDEAIAYHPFPHRYRTEVLYKSETYMDWLNAPDWKEYTWYQFCRDPVKRLLSSYRHNLGHGYADDKISASLGKEVSLTAGYSLDDFLTYVESLSLDGRCDVHVKMQRNPVSDFVSPVIVNIDATDMVERMLKIGEELGHPASGQLNNLFRKDDRRKANITRATTFSSADILNRSDARGDWPLDVSVLDSATVARIKRLYARDMEHIYPPQEGVTEPRRSRGGFLRAIATR
jgi:hypothetical protein